MDHESRNRVTSRSWKPLSVYSHEENGDLSPTTAKNFANSLNESETDSLLEPPEMNEAHRNLDSCLPRPVPDF